MSKTEERERNGRNITHDLTVQQKRKRKKSRKSERKHERRNATNKITVKRGDKRHC